MEGAPVVSNTFGCLTTLFDACLINGFNTKTVDSITSSAGVATVTIAAGHGFVADQIVYISGVDQAEYGTEQRVIDVTLTTFTFAVTGTPASPATTSTSITVKAAAQGGWEIYFSDAVGARSKRAYRSTNVLSNKPVLWMDDGQSGGTSDTSNPLYASTYSKKAKVMLCQDMYDINNPKGAYAPYDSTYAKKGMLATSSGSTIIDGWFKWYYARQETTTTHYDYNTPGEANRRWTMVCDDRTIYFFVQQSANYSKAMYSFGEFSSYKTGDTFNSFITATDWYTGANSNWGASYPWYSTDPIMSLNANGKLILRDHHQLGSPVTFSPLSIGTLNGTMFSGYSTGITWPNGPNYSLIIHPVYMFQNNQSTLRGIYPGYYWVVNDMNTTNGNHLLDKTIVTNVTNYSSKKFIICGVTANTEPANGLGGAGKVAFDITGPWW